MDRDLRFGRPMARPTVIALLAVTLLAAGCGGSGGGGDPVEQVPSSGGLRERVAAARSPQPADFPAVQGRTLQAMANAIGGVGTEAAMATSAFDVGTNRVAFGVIDRQGQPVYGPTAVYVAPRPGAKAVGPFPAPADILLTQARYRSRQAATEQDPFAAVYAAQVPFRRRGAWSVLIATRHQGRLIATAASVDVSSRGADPIPQVGERPPRVRTDTLADAKGDVSRIDTRVPADDMHKTSFSELVGRKPVALLFATPQLCASRVCGPVTDIALQMQARYGDRMTFIHQEVYKDNNASAGLREPLVRFHLRTEPWLFVVDRSGRITARLEGSFGVEAFERAVRSGL
jgi:hypothetical protein